jgi:hypothetical protein
MLQLASASIGDLALRDTKVIGDFTAGDHQITFLFKSSSGARGTKQQMDVPFTRIASFAPAAALVHTGDGTRFEITTFGASGDTVRRLVVDGFDERVTAELRLAHREYRVGRMRGSLREAFDSVLSQPMIYRSERPAYKRLIVDRGGRLWTCDYDLAIGDEKSWRVFDVDGSYLGSVSMPPQLHIIEIGNDYVLASRQQRDDMGTYSEVLDFALVARSRDP